MKKLLLVCLCLCLFAPVALAADFDLAAMSDVQLNELRTSIDNELASRAPDETSGAVLDGDLGDSHITVLGAKMSKDYQGADVLIVDYAWSHKSNDTKAFMFAFQIDAYQGGIQCERPILVDGMSADTQLTKIKSGATFDVQCAYLLRDTTSPVELEISELFSFSGEKLTYVFNLPL